MLSDSEIIKFKIIFHIVKLQYETKKTGVAMKKNMGSVDRLIRLIVGAVIIVWGILTANWWGAVGIILLVTGLMNWCPLYIPFKISTIKSGDNKKEF